MVFLDLRMYSEIGCIKPNNLLFFLFLFCSRERGGGGDIGAVLFFHIQSATTVIRSASEEPH